MKDDVGDIRTMYESDPDREVDRLTRHQLEYDLTWRYLTKHLPSTGHVLELGPGPGRYTVELARRGYTVTAQDLSSAMLSLTEQKLDDQGLSERVRLVEGDARDLSTLGDDTFDAALVMGPLYHLIYESDRRRVLRRVYDRLLPGAPIFTAMISRFGIWGHIMKRQPDVILGKEDPDHVLRMGFDPPELTARDGSSFRGYFATPEEIPPLHESAGFETVILAGVEPAIGTEDVIYNDLKGIVREKWLDLLYRLSMQPSVVAASRHMLYVGRKAM